MNAEYVYLLIRNDDPYSNGIVVYKRFETAVEAFCRVLRTWGIDPDSPEMEESVANTSFDDGTYHLQILIEEVVQ